MFVEARGETIQRGVRERSLLCKFGAVRTPARILFLRFNVETCLFWKAGGSRFS